MKERVGSSARDGDGESGTNDVYASRIFGSRLGRPDGFGCSPVGHADKLVAKLDADSSDVDFLLKANDKIELLLNYRELSNKYSKTIARMGSSSGGGSAVEGDRATTTSARLGLGLGLACTRLESTAIANLR